MYVRARVPLMLSTEVVGISQSTFTFDQVKFDQVKFDQGQILMYFNLSSDWQEVVLLLQDNVTKSYASTRYKY